MKRILFIALWLACCSTVATACTQCRPVVKAGVYDQDFAANLGILLLPLAVLLGIAVAIYFSDNIISCFRKSKGDKPWPTTSNAGR